MKRGGYLKRYTRIRQVHPERAAKRRAEAFGDQARMCRLVGCAVPSCRACPPSVRIEPDHATTRGSGGKDDACWPLCTFHHRQRHDLGLRTFERMHGVIAGVVVGRMAELVRAHACDEWAGSDGCCLVCLGPIGEEPCP